MVCAKAKFYKIEREGQQGQKEKTRAYNPSPSRLPLNPPQPQRPPKPSCKHKNPAVFLFCLFCLSGRVRPVRSVPFRFGRESVCPFADRESVCLLKREGRQGIKKKCVFLLSLSPMFFKGIRCRKCIFRRYEHMFKK